MPLDLDPLVKDRLYELTEAYRDHIGATINAELTATDIAGLARFMYEAGFRDGVRFMDPRVLHAGQRRRSVRPLRKIGRNMKVMENVYGSRWFLELVRRGETPVAEVHYRMAVPGYALAFDSHKVLRFDHTAVVMLRDGRCFRGEAHCGRKDAYNRRIGYRIAMGRAFKRAATLERPDFTVDAKLDRKGLWETLKAGFCS